MDQLKTFHFRDCLERLQSKRSDVVSETSSVIVQCNLSVQDFLSCRSGTALRSLLNEDRKCKICLEFISEHKRNPMSNKEFELLNEWFTLIRKLYEEKVSPIKEDI